eukprot:gene101-5512_t
MLELEPPPGVTAWPVQDSLTHLKATIDGPEGGMAPIFEPANSSHQLAPTPE